MNNDLVKCEQCGNIYNRAYLDQVMEHTHNGLDLGETIKGIQVQKMWPESKNISRTYYDTIQDILEIEFRNNHVYHYIDVSMSIWMELLKTDHIGKFYSEKIKGSFRFIQISG